MKWPSSIHEDVSILDLVDDDHDLGDYYLEIYGVEKNRGIIRTC